MGILRQPALGPTQGRAAAVKVSLTVTCISLGLGTQSSALSTPARVLGEAKAGPGRGDTAEEDAVSSLRTRGRGVSYLERKLGRGTPSLTLGTSPYLEGRREAWPAAL